MRTRLMDVVHSPVATLYPETWCEMKLAVDSTFRMGREGDVHIYNYDFMRFNIW